MSEIVNILYILYQLISFVSFSNRALRLTRELEKKFSDRHVVFIGQRRILPKEPHGRRLGQKRPYSRTLTAVHDRILEDLVYPTDIIGKRLRVAVDGSNLLKVCVDL